MKTYYEVSLKNEIVSFDTLEEAMQFADENDCNIISEIGGAWNDYEKCPICEDWYCSEQIEDSGLCSSCHWSGIAHGF